MLNYDNLKSSSDDTLSSLCLGWLCWQRRLLMWVQSLHCIAMIKTVGMKREEDVLIFFLNEGLKCIYLFLDIQEKWLNSEVHHSAEEWLMMKKCLWKECLETDEMISSKCQSVLSFMANICTITVQCGCLLSKVKFNNKGQSLLKGVVGRIMSSVAVLMTCVKSGVYNIFRPGIEVMKSYC